MSLARFFIPSEMVKLDRFNAPHGFFFEKKEVK